SERWAEGNCPCDTWSRTPPRIAPRSLADGVSGGTQPVRSVSILVLLPVRLTRGRRSQAIAIGRKKGCGRLRVAARRYKRPRATNKDRARPAKIARNGFVISRSQGQHPPTSSLFERRGHGNEGRQ